MPSSTENGASIRCAKVLVSCARSRSLSSRSGEPDCDQIARYLRATRRGRSGRMRPWRIGSQSARGISTIRGSDSIRARNRRTARGSGAAGVPELTSRMPIRSAESRWKSGELM